MDKESLLQKITSKKEFSQLPKEAVEAAFKKFDRKYLTDEEKVKKTRALLMEIFSGFGSRKLFSLRERSPEWILKKHLSTRERFPYYSELYKRVLKGLGKNISVIDLGAGVNGFSYSYFEKAGFRVNYSGIEAVGQLVDLTNNYFKREKIKGHVFHFSLFDLEKVKRIVGKTRHPRVLFLFKTLDSLETLERNYSKKLILELKGKADMFVISFPTESMVKREKIRVKRTWILRFIQENFNILDDFKFGAERYILFKE